VLRKMTDECNRGDFDAAEAAICSDAVIIDELAPYQGSTHASCGPGGSLRRAAGML
jgi:hypothetical protein